MTVKLAAKLPQSPARNGLEAYRQEIIDDRERLWVAVVVLKPKSVTEDVETGVTVPTMTVHRIEPILNGDIESVAEYAGRAYDKRHNGDQVPLQIEAGQIVDAEEWLTGDDDEDGGDDDAA